MPKRKGFGGKKAARDFAKLKRKVGRRAPRKTNDTQTGFKFRRVNVAAQSILEEKTGALTSRRLSLDDLLTKLRHYSAGVRKQGHIGIRELFRDYPEDVDAKLQTVLGAEFEGVADVDSAARGAAVATLEAILDEIEEGQFTPAVPLLTAHTRAALTHLDSGVRRSAITALRAALENFPGSFSPSTAESLLQALAPALTRPNTPSSRSASDTDTALQCVCALLSSGTMTSSTSENDDFNPYAHAQATAVLSFSRRIGALAGPTNEAKTQHKNTAGFSTQHAAKDDTTLWRRLVRAATSIWKETLESRGLGRRSGGGANSGSAKSKAKKTNNKTTLTRLALALAMLRQLLNPKRLLDSQKKSNSVCALGDKDMRVARDAAGRVFAAFPLLPSPNMGSGSDKAAREEARILDTVNFSACRLVATALGSDELGHGATQGWMASLAGAGAAALEFLAEKLSEKNESSERAVALLGTLLPFTGPSRAVSALKVVTRWFKTAVAHGARSVRAAMSLFNATLAPPAGSYWLATPTALGHTWLNAVPGIVATADAETAALAARTLLEALQVYGATHPIQTGFLSKSVASLLARMSASGDSKLNLSDETQRLLISALFYLAPLSKSTLQSLCGYCRNPGISVESRALALETVWLRQVAPCTSYTSDPKLSPQELASFIFSAALPRPGGTSGACTSDRRLFVERAACVLKQGGRDIAAGASLPLARLLSRTVREKKGGKSLLETCLILTRRVFAEKLNTGAAWLDPLREALPPASLDYAISAAADAKKAKDSSNFELKLVTDLWKCVPTVAGDALVCLSKRTGACSPAVLRSVLRIVTDGMGSAAQTERCVQGLRAVAAALDATESLALTDKQELKVLIEEAL